MQHFFNSRLQIYDRLICKYDILDKEFLFDSNSMFKLNFIKISCYINFLNNRNFSLIFNKEFLTFQKTSFNTKFKELNNNFIKFYVTLRKLTLYLCLELFLHTYFLIKNILFNLNIYYCNYVVSIKKFNGFFKTKFLTNLNYDIFDNNNILIYLFFKNISITNLKKQLNYYFVLNK